MQKAIHVLRWCTTHSLALNICTVINISLIRCSLSLSLSFYGCGHIRCPHEFLRIYLFYSCTKESRWVTEMKKFNINKLKTASYPTSTYHGKVSRKEMCEVTMWRMNKYVDMILSRWLICSVKRSVQLAYRNGSICMCERPVHHRHTHRLVQWAHQNGNVVYSLPYKYEKILYMNVHVYNVCDTTTGLLGNSLSHTLIY